VAEIACLDMALPGVTQGRELILKTERNWAKLLILQVISDLLLTYEK
jgi:hypothetical protein